MWDWDGSGHGVFTKRPGVLTNDFIVNLLDMNTEWKPTDWDFVAAWDKVMNLDRFDLARIL